MASERGQPCRPWALPVLHGTPLCCLLLLLISCSCPRAEAAAVTSPRRSGAHLEKSFTTSSATPGQKTGSVTRRDTQSVTNGAVTRPDTPDFKTGSVSRSDNLGQNPAPVVKPKGQHGTVRRWPSVRVVTPGGLSDFGWVRTSGAGVYQCEVYSRTCFNLTAFSRRGAPFDKGPKQRAFFVAYLSSGQVSLAAVVTYSSSRSSHRVCFTVPTVATYQLEVRLVFVNTDAILKAAIGPIAQGFSNYTRVLKSSVKVQGPAGYSLERKRSTLPLCTHGILTESRNRGYWLGDTWVPLSCRLPRLEPAEVLRCLSGKRVLMLGDSQTRIAFGVLQAFLASPSRKNFTARFASRPRLQVDTIVNRVNANNGLQYNTYNITGDRQPPKDNATGLAFGTRIDFLKGVYGTFFGDIRNGFVFLRVRTTVERGGSRAPVEVDFNLTYSTLLDSKDPIFSPWMLDGRLTGGVLPIGNGGPFDAVFNANGLHDVSNFNTSTEYANFMTRKFLPGLSPMLKDSSSLTMFGGMSAVEWRFSFSRMRPSNPRIVAFENAGLKASEKKGYSTMKMQYVTSPRQDLAVDPVHYGWPVSLTMIDLWLGAHCSKTARTS